MSVSGPFSRLPMELLTEIFLCLQDAKCCFEWLRVTHVCQFWRQVALNYPRLWSHVCVRPDSHPDLVRTILGRSQEMPLAIQVGEADEYYGRGDLPEEMALDLLAPYAGRIKSLSIFFAPSQLEGAEACLAAFGTNVTHLSLIVPDTIRHGYPMDAEPLEFSLQPSQLPCLKQLVAFGVAPDAPAAVLSKLTYLDVRYVSNFGLLQMLPSCVALEELTLIDTYSPSEPPPQDVVHLPETLHIFILKEFWYSPSRILPFFVSSPGTSVNVTCEPGHNRLYRGRHRKVGILSCAWPLQSMDATTEPRWASTRLVRFRVVERRFEIGGDPCVPGGEPWWAMVQIREGARMDLKMLTTALEEFADAVDKMPNVDNLDLHLAPHSDNPDWEWVSTRFGRIRALTVGGACAVTSFLEDAAAREGPCLQLAGLAFCLRDLTVPVLGALKACAEVKERTGKDVLGRWLEIHLARAARQKYGKRLEEWASTLSSLVKITFRFEYCPCCTSFTEEDWDCLEEQEDIWLSENDPSWSPEERNLGLIPAKSDS